MRVDHLVWYCGDLARGEADLARIMDCKPAYGGIHPNEGTRNSLVSLAGNTYVEILGRDPAQAEAGLDPELRMLTGAGLYHWAMGGADLSELQKRAIAAGLDGSELVTGGRTLPDGRALKWKLFGIRTHAFGALVPFFIDWMDSDHPAKTAPRGGRLVKIEVVSPQAQDLREIYRVLGIDVEVGAAAKAGLSAIIESGSGRHELRMFDPLPRGFVI